MELINEISDRLKKTENQIDFVCLFDNGRFEGFYPKAFAGCHNIYSVSKNFTATAVGIAQDMGLLNVNDRLSDYFADELKGCDEKYGDVKIRHLLAQTTGIENGFLFESDRYDFNPDDHSAEKYNWLKYSFSAPLKYEPGEHFTYSNTNFYILSCLITRVTGMKLDNFLRLNLFEKLGICNFAWERSPQDEPCGATGLYLYGYDMIKLGILYMNGGVWNGNRLLSQEWVSQALTNQVCKEGQPEYGYSFWLKKDGFECNGAGGQIIRVFPDKKLIFSAQASDDWSFDELFGDLF